MIYTGVATHYAMIAKAAADAGHPLPSPPPPDAGAQAPDAGHGPEGDASGESKRIAGCAASPANPGNAPFILALAILALRRRFSAAGRAPG
jgi:uncharacterized protein (TIGR03382 family)